MVKLKKNSRRQKLSQKFNIEKKVREHRRKMRKMAKQKDGPVRKKHRRDPGIPNSCPFKQDIIRTIQLRKQQNEASRALFFERQKQQEQKCSGGSGVVGQMSGEGATLQDSTDLCHSSSPALSGKPAEDSPSSLALQSLMDAATAGQAKYHAWEQGREDSSTARGCAGVAMTAPQEHYLTQQGRQQHQLLRRVLQQADVIVEVLDARMPDAFRCPALERWILGAGKKLILVMNKVDLVPKEAAVAWLKALQKGIAPALAFKCAGGSAGARKRGIKRGGKRKLKNWTDVEPLEASDHLRNCSSRTLGASALLRLLNCLAHTAASSKESDESVSLAAEQSLSTSSSSSPSSSSSSPSPPPSSLSSSSKQKSSLVVGIVGYPNVGKSSLVNALTRSCNSAGVAALPGSTKTLQFVRIDKHIQLIDSPGVFFAPSKNPQDDALLLPASSPSSAQTSSSSSSSSSSFPSSRFFSSSSSTALETPGTPAENHAGPEARPTDGESLCLSQESSSSFVLRSLLPVHRVENPEELAGAVVAWCCQETLQRLYQLEAYTSPSEFFSALARRRGKLKKGGVPDSLAAAKIFLQDWQCGVVPYYTMPPSSDSDNAPQDALSEEKKVFWKESATGDEMTGEPDAVKSSSEDPRMSRNEASSSSSLEAEKEVYAELLSSQCRAIIRGEGEGEEDAEMGGGSADGTTSRKRKSSAAPQRRFMLLRFAPIPVSGSATREKSISSPEQKKVNLSGGKSLGEGDSTEHPRLAAKKEAKKKRKLLNKRRRLLGGNKEDKQNEEEDDGDASMEDEDEADASAL